MGANDCCCGRFNAAGGSKIIAIASIVISAICAVLAIWQYVNILQANEKLIALLGESLNALDGYSEHLNQQKNVWAAIIAVTIICILVAVALLFAVKKRNPMLALPFMIWTILCQIAAGIFIAALIFLLVANMSSGSDGTARSDEGYFSRLVAFLVFTVVMFVLNTWWLIVVFAFRRLLRSGHAFDSIPMQAA